MVIIKEYTQTQQVPNSGLKSVDVNRAENFNNYWNRKSSRLIFKILGTADYNNYYTNCFPFPNT